MVAPHRLILAALLLGIGLGVSGCETSDMVDKVQGAMQDFNPFGTAKKPLPGSRKALFPEGVPGVEQGVPAELMPGAARPEAIPEPAPAVQPRVAEPKPRARRVRTTAAPPTQQPARPRRAQQQRKTEPPADGVWPAPAQPSPGRQPAQPASQPARQPAPQPAQQPGGSAWPAPAPSSQPTPTLWPDPPK